jgi:hypothetical protein
MPQILRRIRNFYFRRFWDLETTICMESPLCRPSSSKLTAPRRIFTGEPDFGQDFRIPGNLVLGPNARVFPAGLLPNEREFKVGYVGRAVDDRTLGLLPNPNFHPNENQRFFASSPLLAG